MPQRFTEEEHARGVQLFHESGASEAAAQMGCSKQTIYNWVRESIDPEKTPEELAHEAAYQATLRASMRRRLLERIDAILDRFDQPHYDYRGKDSVRVTWDEATSGDIRAYATAIGILIDKYRLESGEYTDRTYHGGTDDIDRSVAQLVAEIKQRDEAGTP